MTLSKADSENCNKENLEKSSTKKRRERRKRLQAARAAAQKSDLNTSENTPGVVNSFSVPNKCDFLLLDTDSKQGETTSTCDINTVEKLDKKTKNCTMSSKEAPDKTRDDVLAAREAKKLAKQKAKKGKTEEGSKDMDAHVKSNQPSAESQGKIQTGKEKSEQDKQSKVPSGQTASPKSKDEVDRAIVKENKIEQESQPPKERLESDSQKSKEQIQAERAAKKAAKQAKKKGLESGDVTANPDMTVKDVVETLKDIKNVAKEMQDLTAKVSAIHIEANIKPEESSKSKAELRAERRAKQEAQRAAKQVAVEQKSASKAKVEPAKTEVVKKDEVAKEKSPKPKLDKAKPKSVSGNRVNWFQHLYTEHDKEALKNITINSNLHPAIIKLGVQLSSRVVKGSNARCIALLDALKQMIRDYSLPAKTEFARGLESQLVASVDFLWAMRQPTASQTNALKFFRHQLTQLPNNVDEFDAKKTLQEEIDKYIEDQIDKAGEAISMAVRNKISSGDNILTFGYSSLVERILREAWEAGLQFHTVVVGERVKRDGREMLRRLLASKLPCSYVDMTALSYVIKSVNKVLLGAGSLLANGCVLGAAGTAQVSLAARAHNVPVLVACETHKVSERVLTDAFVYNEIGNPDDLIDESDENSPLKGWRSNPNLTPLNLSYDVTPPSLVTAVVTEKAILPCTSAPVVLRTKLSEYGI